MLKNNIPNQIRSPRLIFKPVQKTDLDIFYQAFSESFQTVNGHYIPAWSQYISIPSKEEMRPYIDRIISEFLKNETFVFFVFDQDNNFVGQCELHHIDYSVPKSRIGYWVRDSEMGKGYATEMANIMTRLGFDILGCKRLEIRNDVRNPASGRIAKKLGYRFLTVLEKNKQGKPGDYWDIEIYDRLDKKDLPELEVVYDPS